MFPEEQAMVMQWIEQPSLRELLYRSHRFGFARQTRDLTPVFRNMGSWLRKHHELPSLEHCETRSTTRDEYLTAIERFVSYLSKHTTSAKDVIQIHDAIVSTAKTELPSTIPTGQVHGDYAPRNAFVGPRNQVTVFDTLGRFEAPIYEDIAKLLMTVKACGPQLISGGFLYNSNLLQRYEQAFLAGYFHDQPIPIRTVRLFEAQLLLEHWAAAVYRHHESRGLKRAAKGFRRGIWQSGFKSYLRQIVSDIHGPKTDYGV